MRAETAVITRTKNRPGLLKRAMRSVSEQTYTDWVHIIVNDGGDLNEVEKSLSALDKHHMKKVKIVNHETSKGMEAASNAGIRSCESMFIVIHDDDDSWDSKFLEKMVAALKETSSFEIAGVVCHSHLVRELFRNNRLKVLGKTPYNPWLFEITIPELLKENCFPPISFLFKRDQYEAVGGFDEKLPVLGDWDFNLKIIQRAEIRVLPEPLAFYHHRMSDLHSEYSNSVIGGNRLHRAYHALIVNGICRTAGTNPNKLVAAAILGAVSSSARRANVSQRTAYLIHSFYHWIRFKFYKIIGY
jgi:glycosyltransferase involved in cell wall biosynthesis